MFGNVFCKFRRICWPAILNSANLTFISERAELIEAEVDSPGRGRAMRSMPPQFLCAICRKKREFYGFP